MALVDAVVLFGGKDAAQGRPHAQGLEVIARDQLSGGAFGLAAESDRGIGLVAAEDRGKSRRALLEILVHGVGGHAHPAVAAHVRTGGPDHHKLLGIAHGQEAQQELVHQGEDGGIGADAQGQRGHRNQGKQRAAGQVAKGEFDIRKKSAH